MYRGVVTTIDTAGLWVRIADQGVVGPLPWVGQPPTVGGSVLVADAGQPGQPDLIVLGSVPGLAALTTTDHGVPRFDGTTGKIQTSALTISDTGVLGGLANGSAATDAVTKSQLDGKLTTPGAWTTYNPSWGNVSMSATDAKFCQIGKTVHFRCTGTLSDAPGGAVTVDMPTSMASDTAHGPVRLLRSGSYQGVWFYSSASVALVRYLDDANTWQNLTSTAPASWVSGDKIALTGTYEAS